MSGVEFLQTLDCVINDRLQEGHENSYTAKLGADGVRRVAQKVGEEAVELAIASVDGDRDETLSEAADLVYHLMVLLRVQGFALSDVAQLLEQRHSDQSVR